MYVYIDISIYLFFLQYYFRYTYIITCIIVVLYIYGLSFQEYNEFVANGKSIHRCTERFNVICSSLLPISRIGKQVINEKHT